MTSHLFAVLESPLGRLRLGLLLVNAALGLVLLRDLAGRPDLVGAAGGLGVVLVLIQWARALGPGRLPSSADATAFLTLGALGLGAGVTQEVVAFAVGAFTKRALYPRRIGWALVGYPAALAVGGLGRWGQAPPVRPPVGLGLATVVLLALAIRAVVMALEEQELLRTRLCAARDELERRVDERTEEMAGAHRSLSRRFWEAEQTRRLLKRNEEYFRALIENGSDIVLVLRPDGRIRYGSPSVTRIMGYRSGALDGPSFAEVVVEADVPRALETFGRVLESPDEVVSVRLRVRHADGGVRHLEAAVRNLLATPAVEGIVVTARDVSERVAMEEALRAQEAELRQAQKMEAVGRLAGGVAHDFNNILTVIGGHAEYLGKRLTVTDPLQAEAGGITDAVARAARLTRQLLVFSRREVFQPRVLDANTVVGEVDALVRRLLPETVGLETELAARRWTIRADPGHLEQVILNLVVNARDAMPGGGTVRLETADVDVVETIPGRFGDIEPGRYVRLSVSDTGAGVPEDTLDHIFDPFFTTKAGGTGLGLSTVFGIVREAGAGIRVESRPGQGTTFSAYFPGHEAEVGDEVAPDPEMAPASGETLLLVEDETSLRALAARSLRDRGYVVLSAANGEDALRMAGLYADPIDLLVTDVVMPGLTGPALHGELEARLGRVPVLFVSGYPGEELTRCGVKDGPFLAKPYTGRGLERAVREVLDLG